MVSLVFDASGLVFAYRTTILLGAEVEWIGLVWQAWPLAVVVVGVVVAAAQPRILVGWGLLAAGLSIQVVVFGGAYGGWAHISDSPSPLAGVAIWAGMVATGVFVATAPLIVSCLPSGRPDTRPARTVARLSWVLGAALVGWWGLGDELLSVNTMSEVATEGLENPFALIHFSRPVTVSITSGLTVALLGCFVTSIILVLLRRRRASAVERAQLRWLAAGLLVLPIVAIVTTLLGGSGAHPGWMDVLVTIALVTGLGAIPVSIAISVLKFRLFEIDRLISRTVVFAVVALVLGALYAMLAILPFTLVVGMGGGDTPSWVVAASTLAAAALFSPLRRRVQRVVDRRFNRARYDAERVVERFSAQVREFTDVAAITAGLTGAVRGALQPAGVAVWLVQP